MALNSQKKCTRRRLHRRKNVKSQKILTCRQKFNPRLQRLWNLYSKFYLRGFIWDMLSLIFTKRSVLRYLCLQTNLHKQLSTKDRCVLLILHLLDVPERFDGLCPSSSRWIHTVFGMINRLVSRQSPAKISPCMVTNK